MILGSTLPKFSSNDKAKLNRVLDFIGINHYASFYANDFISSVCESGPGVPTTEGLYQQTAQNKLKKGLDFIGINYYTASYVQDCIYTKCDSRFGTSRTEGSYMKSADKNGVSIGESTPFSWFNIYPQGMEKTVTYVKDRYNNTPMFITENGYAEQDDPNVSLENQLGDFKRIKYMENHIEALSTAIRKGADVRGYFAWSLLDNFEWIYGYTVRYGIHHVDFATLKRTPRLSARWYKRLIANYKQTEFTGVPKLVQST
ncbi:beta-glucosidase 47-like protein [Trifolium pratense]|uniref:Beta-glucosidase 47-like protein n=1 Tax=Trifolium pratense TaxID=57577 RepID=A0A2K3N7V3_TRIPR|nr:beta-glucosidase 47-like protein [Trifolium pratense]